MSRADVTPGSAVGTYVVQGQLGATAWADTFVATGSDDGKAFALTVFDASDDGAWPEIERTKTQLEGVLDHLVLGIAGLGHDEGAGVRFIATPLSDHPSLADLVDIYALSPSEAIALVKNLGIALDNAQASGLVHLALKPSNVFVGPPPTYAVRVVDFGKDALRRAKSERGDVAWLAPEQLDADGPADARADVFTAALLAFFTMTGKRYWTSHDADAIADEVRGPRVAPSERARALGADVPAKLDAVLLGALGAKDARPESVRAFAEALEAALAEPAAKRAPPSEEARSSERHVKATQKLEKFRMPTLENAAPSGPQPLPQKTQKLPPARIPDAASTPAVASGPTAPVTPIEPVAVRPRRTVYIPQRVLVVLAVLVTALTLGVTIAAFRKIRRESLPAAPSASISAAPATTEAPLPPTSIVVPPPPAPPEEPASAIAPLGANESELEIVCTPACEKVFVDGKPAADWPAPLRLPPGRHGVGVGKSGHGGQFRLVTLKPGERHTVSSTLAPSKK